MHHSVIFNLEYVHSLTFAIDIFDKHQQETLQAVFKATRFFCNAQANVVNNQAIVHGNTTFFENARISDTEISRALARAGRA